MTVKELIKALKKMPQDYKVWWSDHDQAMHETSDGVNQVEIIDPNDMKDWERDLMAPEMIHDKPYVVLRP